MAFVWDKALFDELYGGKPWVHGYRFGGNTPRPPSFHYHWYCQQNSFNHRIAQMLELPGFASLTDVAVIGGAFGWLAEALVANGINAFSVDTSPYVIDNENVSEEQELRDALTAQGFDPDNVASQCGFYDPALDRVLTEGEIWAHWLRADGKRTSIAVEAEDMGNSASRNRVKRRAQGTLDAIVTEHAIESMETDAESLSLIEQAEQTRPNPACTVVHLTSGGTGDPRFNWKTGTEWKALLDANGFTDHWVVEHGVVVP